MDVKQPHKDLGLQEDPSGGKVIRLFRPGSEQVFIEHYSQNVETFPIGQGFFEYRTSASTTKTDYRIFHNNGLLAYDPYAFWPTIGPLDEHLFSAGLHYKIYEKMGGRLCIHEGIKGAKFSLWAPSAQSVSLIAEFNHWNYKMNPMRAMGVSGIFEIFIPGLCEGHCYKFYIIGPNGDVRIKADPYALTAEMRPLTASKLADVDSFEWTDKERPLKNINGPFNVYEVHLGSWRKDEWRFKNYRILAHELAVYCQEMGFTHVELMPIMEHPLDESWGYQVTGFFAVTSRFGSIHDFQYFVNHLHQHNIGVILDWVPAHFPTDDHALRFFDGTHLYEHINSKQGYHPHWNTCIFNYGRKEVSNFLIANALFWFDKMHIDGLRVDAVASMIYLDYGRDEGQWIPNIYGSKENLEAIEFLKHLNSVVHQEFPEVLMIAEESTFFPGVTEPLERGGLGFDLKWNMGWMNDTLDYFKKDSLFRKYHHNELTFGILYAFSEHFQLVLSHDEVVHGKKSLLSKMPGDYWQKFANLRLLLSYLFCQPGKKLLFMGGEFGQFNEWNSQKPLDWELLQLPSHKGIQEMVKVLGALYKEHSSLWEKDFTYEGYDWIDINNYTASTICYRRKSLREEIICIHNFTPQYYSHYYIEESRAIEELFCSDAACFGGTNKCNPTIQKEGNGFVMQLAPLATHIFKICPTKIT